MALTRNRKEDLKELAHHILFILMVVTVFFGVGIGMAFFFWGR